MRACGAQHLSSCCSLRCLVCTAWCASSGCTTSFCAGLRPLQFEQQLEASLRKKKQQERLNEEHERRQLQQQQQQKEQQQQQEQQQRRAAAVARPAVAASGRVAVLRRTGWHRKM